MTSPTLKPGDRVRHERTDRTGMVLSVWRDIHFQTMVKVQFAPSRDGVNRIGQLKAESLKLV